MDVLARRAVEFGFGHTSSVLLHPKVRVGPLGRTGQKGHLQLHPATQGTAHFSDANAPLFFEAAAACSGLALPRSPCSPLHGTSWSPTTSSSFIAVRSGVSLASCSFTHFARPHDLHLVYSARLVKDSTQSLAVVVVAALASRSASPTTASESESNQARLVQRGLLDRSLAANSFLPQSATQLYHITADPNALRLASRLVPPSAAVE